MCFGNVEHFKIERLVWAYMIGFLFTGIFNAYYSFRKDQELVVNEEE